MSLKADQHGSAVDYIKRSMSFTLCNESCDCTANTKPAQTQFNYSFLDFHNTVVNTFIFLRYMVHTKHHRDLAGSSLVLNCVLSFFFFQG